MDKFWQQWNSRFSNKTCKPSNIDGLTDNTSIANHFCDSFASVYFDSYEDNADVVACLEKIQSLEMLEKGNTDKKCRKLIDVCDTEYGLKYLKAGKASGLDNLCKENVMYAHPIIITHLTNSFNMILMHGFVQDKFGFGVTVPVVKDKLGDVTAASNYRSITLSPIISKIFEYGTVQKYEYLLSSDTLQSGFKKHLSRLHAIFVLT